MQSPPASHGMLSAKLSTAAPPCSAGREPPVRCSDRMHSSTRSSNVSEMKRWHGRALPGPRPAAESKAGMQEAAPLPRSPAQLLALACGLEG